MNRMFKCREGQDVRERPHDQCEALAARPQSAISLNYRNASVVELVDDEQDVQVS